MILRKYKSDDCLNLLKLFYDTVRTVNKKDYNDEQLSVWAPDNYIEEKYDIWQKSLSENFTIVAEINREIAGFGDIEKTGYLNRLFIHKDYQHRGIASSIVTELEKYAEKICIHTIITEASITAKPFFERIGYSMIKEQQVERKGIFLTNYVMEKNMLK
ncbi:MULTISPECIES: GNAT family N-acetyltransferase [Fusobacterium]|uniref:GNAT family N-acetyltransferase n=1 Tax=Fusobacterium TaxID=848 RepID=UPI0008A28AD8|nr:MULTISPECIES: GNAT family N-acetyltransferase [Fusobacterium]OFL80167.1 acetyltransferase [Fusobacterium sp. HMSC073F01]